MKLIPNWRKLLIYGLLYVSGSKIPQYLKDIKRIDRLSIEEKKRYQQNKLKVLLLHAYNNVPYYKRVLSKTGVVIDGTVYLDNFKNIPVLNKDIIRQEGSNLYSKDYRKRKPYENTSGGSTGEPVRFVQDKKYDEWNKANKIFMFRKLGKEIGEKEIKFWGSDRDILEGTAGINEKLSNYLYNRIFINAFNLTKENFFQYADMINNYMPAAIWAYYDSMYELCRYINKHGMKLNNPKVIVTTIGKLSHEMYGEIKKAFPESLVIDQYGSREAGALAFQYEERGLFNYFPWSHLIEIAGLNNRIIQKEGKILITTLTNYSMPLIRYEVGDMGYYNQLDDNQEFTFREVVGRTFAHFIREDGTLIQAQFFVTLMFHKDWIEKFQIIQKEVNIILIVIQKVGVVIEEDVKEIESKVKTIMGSDCIINWHFVDEIKPSPSGKYLYTICEVK